MTPQEQADARCKAVTQINAELQTLVPLWQSWISTGQMPSGIPEWVQIFAQAVTLEDGTPNWPKVREFLANRTADLAGIPYEVALEAWADMGKDQQPAQQ